MLEVGAELVCSPSSCVSLVRLLSRREAHGLPTIRHPHALIWRKKRLRYHEHALMSWHELLATRRLFFFCNGRIFEIKHRELLLRQQFTNKTNRPQHPISSMRACYSFSSSKPQLNFASRRVFSTSPGEPGWLH